MDFHRSTTRDSLWARLRTLQSSGATLGPSAFTPGAVLAALRMLLDLYPAVFRQDTALQDRVLRAFATTIIPGADIGEPDLVRMYHDTDYPFYPYTGFLVYDLETRAGRLHGGVSFERISADDRTSVVQDALNSDDTTSRLYRGAILMAQVSYYAGIYHPERGCELIEFPGRNGGFSLEESSYPWAESALGYETTFDGNPR